MYTKQGFIKLNLFLYSRLYVNLLAKSYWSNLNGNAVLFLEAGVLRGDISGSV